MSCYDEIISTITMSYDRVGNLIEATTAGVVTNLYAYDLQGHCTNEWQNDFQLTRFYDALGRSTGYAINGERQTTIAYDTYGRIATMRTAEGGSGVLTASNGGEFRWTYLPNSDLKSSLTYPNGLTASWTYDANNQLLQVRNATPTNVISQFDYTYDAAGRRTAIAKSGTAFGDLSGSIDAYTYNARSELTSARRTKNGQPIPGFSEDFDYDPIGNRRSSATYNEKGEAQTSTYQANNLNQYTQRTTPGYAAVRGETDPNATVTVNENSTFRLGSYYFGSDLFDNTAAGGLANLETYATLGQFAANGDEAEDLVSAMTNQVYLAQSPETFAYDDDGNQTLISTKTGLWRVTYNGENRPILWVCDSGNTALVMNYDHMGRRRAKNDQRFFYDGCLQVADNSGNVYSWDCTENVATRPLAWCNCAFETPHSALYYTHDGNKNVSEVASAQCDLSAHYEYAPFGAVILQQGESAATNPWRFSSEFAEDDTATVYYNYRHYEPVTGRWISRDPIPTDALGITSYDFCLQNAISIVDLLGLEESGCNSEFISSHSVSLLPMIGGDIFSGITDKFNSKIKLKWVELSASFSVNGSVTFENKRCACCVREGEVVDEIWDGSISGTVTLDVYSHHDSLTVSGLEVSYWFGAKGSISGTISGSIGGASDRCNGKDLEATLSYSLGARGSVDVGGSFAIKLARFVSYTGAAYGGISAGYDFKRVYKKHGGGPWVLEEEESGWSGDLHVHFDAGFASYDYTRSLF